MSKMRKLAFVACTVLLGCSGAATVATAAPACSAASAKECQKVFDGFYHGGPYGLNCENLITCLKAGCYSGERAVTVKRTQKGTNGLFGCRHDPYHRW